jgi:TolA-binding protein
VSLINIRERVQDLEENLEELRKAYNEAQEDNESKLKQAHERAQRLAREYMRNVTELQQQVATAANTEAPGGSEVEDDEMAVEFGQTIQEHHDEVNDSKKKLRKGHKSKKNAKSREKKPPPTKIPVHLHRNEHTVSINMQ